MYKHFFSVLYGLVLTYLFPQLTLAANLNEDKLSILWGIPFIGLICCIAIGPLLFARFWNHNLGRITLIWILIFIFPFISIFGVNTATSYIVRVVFEEYIPFIVLLIALFVVTGGIYIHCQIYGTPKFNTSLLALGAILSNFIGTTGASMLLIRPLIRANSYRKYIVHIIIFFIFLVSNIGGSLTPLGDPPLFLGFLKGVNFFWISQHIFLKTLFLCVALLIIFYYLDYYYFKKENRLLVKKFNLFKNAHIYFSGKWNFILIIIIINIILMSKFWKSKITFSILDTSITLENFLRDIGLIGIIIISAWITPKTIYISNNFSWKPILEVTKLFIGIFITIIPFSIMLQEKTSSAFSTAIHLIMNEKNQPIDAIYFWITGLLSSFLDNTPTYLVFFNIVSSDANVMMTTFSSTLEAISAGTVFMGANSYIGNSPNLIIKTIAEEYGIKMPSFFGYMKWTLIILIPLFIIMTFIFFI